MFSADNLTSRQKEILEFLRQYQAGEGTAPTYREIARRFRFRSTKAASDHVRALEKKGYIRCHRGRSRGIELLSSDETFSKTVMNVPILGNIPAGNPEAQPEYLRDMLAIDQAMLGSSVGHRLFALRVNGESMTGRGIHSGDWVVADADASPHEGDMVVALIDGMSTLKTLSKRQGQFFLKAENPNHRDLIPAGEMVVQGVIRIILRQVS